MPVPKAIATHYSGQRDCIVQYQSLKTSLTTSIHIIANVLVIMDNVFVLGDKVHHTPGDWWMIHRPTDYIPRTEIGNIQRKLDFNQ